MSRRSRTMGQIEISASGLLAITVGGVRAEYPGLALGQMEWRYNQPPTVEVIIRNLRDETLTSLARFRDVFEEVWAIHLIHDLPPTLWFG